MRGPRLKASLLSLALLTTVLIVHGQQNQTSNAQTEIEQAQQKVRDAAKQFDQSTLDGGTANEVKNIERMLVADSQVKKDSEIAKDAIDDIIDDITDPKNLCHGTDSKVPDCSPEPPGFLDEALAALRASTPSYTASPITAEVNNLTPQRQDQVLQDWRQYCDAQQSLDEATQQLQNTGYFNPNSLSVPDRSGIQNAQGPQIGPAPAAPAPAQWRPMCPSAGQTNQFFNYVNSRLSQMASPYRPHSVLSPAPAVRPANSPAQTPPSTPSCTIPCECPGPGATRAC